MSIEGPCPKCGSVRISGTAESSCPTCDRAQQDTVLHSRADAGATVLDAPRSRPAEFGSDQRSRFGDYELIHEVARGGMGVVYKARQVSLDRVVALKMILGLASDSDIKRFILEAQAAARLRHPNIVAIHEVGAIDGEHFYSMEFVEGQSLSQLIRESPLSARKAAEYVRKVALAIAYAHQGGILHRDLKPGNVLVDWSDEPRVTDFGLAKLMHSDTQQTLSGTIMGTPSYMSPEQASGHSVDARSDVYSLGALLYELVTGIAPFRAETPVATLRLVLEKDAVAPRQLNPKIPQDLETVCLKCLEKAPARRFQSAEEFAADLRRFLEGEPITARRISAAGRVVRWCKRKPALASVGAAAGLLLALFIYQLNVSRVVALEGEQKARREAYVADMATVKQAMEEGNGRYALKLLRAHIPRQGQVDLRGWEWRYYWRACQGDPTQILTRHQQDPHSIQISPNAGWLAAHDFSGETSLFNIRDRQVSLRFMTSSQSAVGAFSPDEHWFAAPDNQGALHLWDLHALTKIRTLPVAGTLHRVGFSGGELIALTGRLHRWRIETGELISESDLPPGESYSATPDFRRIAIGQTDQLILLDTASPASGWQRATGHVTSGGHGSKVAMSRDGRWIAVAIMQRAGSGYTIQVWDAETGERKHLFPAHSAVMTHLEFAPNGKYLLSASFDQTAVLWDTSSWKAVNVFRGHNGTVNAASFFPDGKQVVTAGGGETRLWQTEVPGGRERVFGLPENLTIGLISAFRSAFSPDGRFFAAVDKEGRGLLIDALAQTPVRELSLPFSDVEKAALGPEAKVLAFGRSSEDLVLWNLQGNLHEFPPVPLGDTVRAISFSPNGQLLGVSARQGAFRVWDMNTRAEITQWRAALSNVVDLQFSADSHILACGHENGSVTLWDTRTRATTHRLRPHPIKVNHIALSPDGKRVASTSYDKTVAVYDLATGAELTRIDGGQTSFFRVFFSPDGQRIAYNEWGNAHLADVLTGRELARLNTYIPRFLDENTMLGLNESGFWLWQPPPLTEIDLQEEKVNPLPEPAAEP